MEAEKTSILLSRCRKGDEAARNTLFTRYRRLLERWAHGRIPSLARDAADTGDLVQVTLIRAFQGLDGFDLRRDGAFLAWLRSILWNEVRERMRKGVRRGRPEDVDDGLPDPGRSPLESAEDAEVRDRYEAALEGLAALDRAAVVARAEFDLSYEEIAAELEPPSANAARLRTNRAFAKLEHALERLRYP